MVTSTAVMCKLCCFFFFTSFKWFGGVLHCCMEPDYSFLPWLGNFLQSKICIPVLDAQSRKTCLKQFLSGDSSMILEVGRGTEKVYS